MDNENRQTTAKIYQFPIRNRELDNRRRSAPTAGLAYSLGKASALPISGAWYHDAAIKDDERKR